MIIGYKKKIHGWTDYPIVDLGDKPYKKAPWRRCVVIGYDGDKYATVNIYGVKHSLGIKRGYIFQGPGWNYPRVKIHDLLRNE